MDNLMIKNVPSTHSTYGSVTLYGIGDNQYIRLVESKCKHKIIDDDLPDDSKFHLSACLRDGFHEMYKDSDKTFAHAEPSEEKEECNISRAKSKLVQLALCNPWDWFCTFTIDPAKYDRFNLSAFYFDFNQWLRNQQRLHGYKIKYLFVPEQHKSGAWHIHGLISGLPVSELQQFKLGDNMSSGMAEKVRSGCILYNWVNYAKKFGFCELDPVQDTERVSKYISKYITKDTTRMNQEVGAHIYYCSKGLNRPQSMKKGTIYRDIAPLQDVIQKKRDNGCKGFYFSENDYCKVVQVPYSDDMLSAVMALFDYDSCLL